MDFKNSGSSELGRDLQKNGPFFFAFWEFRAGRRPPEKLAHNGPFEAISWGRNWFPIEMQLLMVASHRRTCQRGTPD